MITIDPEGLGNTQLSNLYLVLLRSNPNQTNLEALKEVGLILGRRKGRRPQTED